MKTKGIIAVLALGLTLLAGAPAMASSSDWAAEPESAVRLVTAVSATGTLAAIPAGVEFELAPGWKTYWRSPGDAGYPVEVDWQGSENLAAADMRWPAPHRFTLFGLDTFGYADRVVLPVTLVPERPGEPVRLAANVRYLVCEEICIPYEAALSLDIPAGTAGVAPEAQQIAQFESQVPGPPAEHGIEIAQVGIGEGANPSVTVVARSEIPFIAPDLLIEGTGDWRFSAPTLDRRDGNREVVLTAEAVPLAADAAPLDTLPLVFTLVDGTRGAEFAAAASDGGMLAGAGSAGAGMIPMLLIALLGGLILNLMPCVLPVLSLKLLAVIGHGGGEAASVRRSFVATAAGIVAAFLLLALALAALKSSGAAIGWGIQFQQPLFLIAMAAIVTLFAANLAGWFDIRLPSWLGSRLAGGPGRPERGLAGAFATGMLATLLATPCSAPFVGTAVGFALAQGTGDIVAIFLAMGLGLALPYLLVAVRPRIATALPRPGNWMVWLRRLLALALVGTAIWLLTVAAASLGTKATVAAALPLVALLPVLWLRTRLPASLRRAVPVVVVLLVVGALLPTLQPATGTGVATAPGAADDIWQPFDRPAIGALVGGGRTVFVDVTADWCITCEVNKRLVLRRDPVAARLADPSLVAMRADWTRPDDAIAAYLASFGRYGIPFNVVYGPGAPEGIVLPELLDRDGVLAAIERAGGG